jgi:hypothetical protein
MNIMMKDKDELLIYWLVQFDWKYTYHTETDQILSRIKEIIKEIEEYSVEITYNEYKI